MAGIEQGLINFLRQYLLPSPPQTPDYVAPDVIWSMPSNTPRPQRLARAKEESQRADVAINREEQKIRDWYGHSLQGQHSVRSPVDPEFEGTDWEKQYNSYLFNYNNVVTQMNKIDDDFKSGKMSEDAYNKANIALLPVQRALDAKIKQLDAQRRQKAKQILKGRHGDYQI